MSSELTPFFLPLGLSWEGKTYRKGHIRPATTLDELEVENSDEMGLSARYRDVLLLSRVIVDFDTLKSVTSKMIENLYEADFLYLQLLYRELNGEVGAGVTVACPQCGVQSALKLPRFFENMSLYKQPKEEGKE